MYSVETRHDLVNRYATHFAVCTLDRKKVGRMYAWYGRQLLRVDAGVLHGLMVDAGVLHALVLMMLMS